MDKRTAQIRKESFYEINWFLRGRSPHQKDVVSRPLKITAL